MGFSLKGHVLNQRQLNTITPVLNDLMQGRVSQKNFEQACEQALEKAGCSLGYDTGLRHESSIEERISGWIINGRVGASSTAIWARMTGTQQADGYAHPLDCDDLNRCILLLDLIPEWRPRMSEMAACSPEWAALAEVWDGLTDTFLAEAGLDWSKSKTAPGTHEILKAALGK